MNYYSGEKQSKFQESFLVCSREKYNIDGHPLSQLLKVLFCLTAIFVPKMFVDSLLGVYSVGIL